MGDYATNGRERSRSPAGRAGGDAPPRRDDDEGKLYIGNISYNVR